MRRPPPKSIKQATDVLEKNKKEYDKFKNTDEYKSEFHIYASPDREDWDKNFSLSHNEIKRAEEIYNNNALPILKRNDRKEELDLRRQLKKIDNALKYGAKLARKTSLRIGELNEAKKNAKKMTEQAKADYADVNSLFNELDTFIKKNQEQFPRKKEDLDTRLSWFKKTKEDTETALKSVNNEMASSAPDYAVFTDKCSLISADLKEFTKRDKALRKKVSELGRDYSKILE